jgi:hypothetical protein
MENINELPCTYQDGKICFVVDDKAVPLDLPCPECKISPGTIQTYREVIRIMVEDHALISAYIEYVEKILDRAIRHEAHIHIFKTFAEWKEAHDAK